MGHHPFSCYLRHLLQQADNADTSTTISSVEVVFDNCRGLPEECAASYIPPPQRHRSTASMEELRWESEINSSSSSQDASYSRPLYSMLPPPPPSSGCPKKSSPVLPMRRSSLEGLSDDEDSDHDEDDIPQQRSKEMDVLQTSLLQELDHRRRAPSTKKASSPTCSGKACNTPPRAPRRQNSLREEPCSAEKDPQQRLTCFYRQPFETTNLGIIHNTKELEEVEASLPSRPGMSKTASKRRLAVLSNKKGDMTRSGSLFLDESFVLLQDIDEELPVDDNESCCRSRNRSNSIRLVVEEDDPFLDDDSLHMFDSSFKDVSARDSLPFCARRRPSPGIIMMADDSGASTASLDLIPTCARRRPSPEVLEDSLSELNLRASFVAALTTHSLILGPSSSSEGGTRVPFPSL